MEARHAGNHGDMGNAEWGIRVGLALLCALAAAPSATAAPPLADHLNVGADGRCPAYGDLRICSGEVPSWDGSKIDVDLTEPMEGAGAGPRPLIVMLHGFTGDKHDWQSTTDEGDGRDRWHWNSHWFAKHGYYVLTHTARGHKTDPPRGDRPPTPSGSSVDLPSGTVQLKTREAEVRDTQWLAALVAASFDVDPGRIAVTGGSYGGGESWLLAAQPAWTFPHERDPSLPVLQLQVAVPKYPWTDLGYALAPNGHGGGPTGRDLYESSTGRPDSDTGDGNPLGVLKWSYVSGLAAAGERETLFEKGTRQGPYEEGPINLESWIARAEAGDPLDVAGVEDPVVRQIRRGLTELRAPYFQDEGWEAQAGGRKVAVFAIQGWTDDLFPAIEAFRQFKYLKRLDPRWPVALALADVGHARAQNRAATWRRLNAQAWQWTQAHVGGSHEQQTGVYTEPTTCENDGEADANEDASVRIAAQSPEALARGTLQVRFADGDTTTWRGGEGDPNGPATDPVITPLLPVIAPGGPCRESPGPATGGYTAHSQPLEDASTYVGLGHVEVPYTLLGGPTATLNARLWDVAPGGAPALLVSRGTYRLDVPAHDAPAGTLRLPLWGNHWRLERGHRLRLDLTQVEYPTMLPSNVPSAIRFEAPRLVLPIRESGDRVLAGAGS